MSKNKFPIKRPISCFFLVLGGLLLATGCSSFMPLTSAYKADFNNLQQPKMTLQEANDTLKRELLALYYNNGSSTENAQVTSDGFSLSIKGKPYTFKFDDLKSLTVNPDTTAMGGLGATDCYGIDVGSAMSGFSFYWKSLDDAKGFVDAIGAIKYYNSKK